MKQNNNKYQANMVRKAVPVLVNFGDLALCSAVANLDVKIVIEIAQVAEEAEGPFEGLTVKNSKTKRSAFIEIVGEELAEEVYKNPAAVGPIYNMVHYIQSTIFGSGATAAEEKAKRRSNSSSGCSKEIVIKDAFDLACINLGFDPDNLSPWEEEQAMIEAGIIKG